MAVRGTGQTSVTPIRLMIIDVVARPAVVAGSPLRIVRRGVETSQTLGRHRWVIERTFAWINRYRRLVTRYERRSAIHHAFTTLACSLICFNKLPGGFEGHF